MKIVFAAVLAAVAIPASAQMPTAKPAPAPAASAKFTLDTPIETLEADAAARAVLTANLGGDLSQHPMYENFKGMTLTQLAPMSGGKITDDVLKKVATELAAIR